MGLLTRLVPGKKRSSLRRERQPAEVPSAAYVVLSGIMTFAQYVVLYSVPQLAFPLLGTAGPLYFSCSPGHGRDEGFGPHIWKLSADLVLSEEKLDRGTPRQRMGVSLYL